MVGVLGGRVTLSRILKHLQKLREEAVSPDSMLIPRARAIPTLVLDGAVVGEEFNETVDDDKLMGNRCYNVEGFDGRFYHSIE